VDGIPNGNSSYGGGSKANRYIDTENLKSVTVSQGTGGVRHGRHRGFIKLTLTAKKARAGFVTVSTVLSEKYQLSQLRTLDIQKNNDTLRYL
jgi:iron complex outermembrane recepter protein